MVSSRRTIVSSMLGVAVVLSVGTGSLWADTVFLKNGSLIDGTVTHRTDESVLLQIGSIGKLEIPIEDIYLIEKNKRVGGELVQSSLDTKSKVEIVDSEAGNSSDGDGVDDGGGEEGFSEDVFGDAPVVGEEEAGEELDPKLKERIEKLTSELDSPNRRFRVRAERHLKAIGRPAIPSLVPLMKSKRDLTRVAVVRLFYSFGDERVVEACIESLLDVNEYVRDFAHKTLVRLTGEDFGFVAQSTPRRRELAHRKWKKWWEEELESLEETRRAAKGEETEPN